MARLTRFKRVAMPTLPMLHFSGSVPVVVVLVGEGLGERGEDDTSSCCRLSALGEGLTRDPCLFLNMAARFVGVPFRGLSVAGSILGLLGLLRLLELVVSRFPIDTEMVRLCARLRGIKAVSIIYRTNALMIIANTMAHTCVM